MIEEFIARGGTAPDDVIYPVLYRHWDNTDLTNVSSYTGTLLPEITNVNGADWSKSGFTFIGWYRESTDTMYQPGDIAIQLSGGSTPATYYATFEETVESPDLVISYNNSTITSLSTTGTVVLDTAGKLVNNNITIEYTKPVILLQNKTVYPSTSAQTVTADNGYTGLGTVTVNKMPSGVATAPTSVTASAATITVDTSTLTVSKTVSITPRITTPGYIYRGTAGNCTISLTALIKVKGATTYTPSIANQTITSGTYLSGAQTILGDANLVAENIKKDVSIFNITGTYEGGGGDFAGLVQRTLTSVSDSTITTIGSFAFTSYTSLTTISFPNCTSIGSCAFYACTNITTASFPNCTRIGESAFYQCSKLATISFPNCSWIGSYAFQSCGSITTASFSKVSGTINTYAFAFCSKLATISIPNCTSIYAYAFISCSLLTAVSFPKCTFIGSNVFTQCSGLATASFPMCTTIGSSAFAYCRKLLSLYLLTSTVPTLSNINTFNSTPISNYTASTGGVYGSIFVKQSLLASFQTAVNWSVYSARMVGLTDEQIAALGT